MNKLLTVASLAAVATARAAPQPGLRLIARSPDERQAQWMTHEAIDALAEEQIKFIDITDNIDYSSVPINTNRAKNDSGIPTRPTRQTAVKRVIDEFACVTGDCAAGLWPINQHLTTYFNRYYTTEGGVESVYWLADRYVEVAGERLNVDVTVDIHRHQYPQSSIIVKMIGATRPNEVVVLGAHTDSIAGRGDASGNRAPGFDDDGSGTATVFSVFENLIQSGYVPDRTVEFHAYAAEEVGLRGSADVARVYRGLGVDVVTMTAFDMTCYSPRKLIGMTDDFTDSELNNFLNILLAEYTGIASEPSLCGYGCSDHASFTNNGYKSAFPFEAKFQDRNPWIHSTQDTGDKCDREYMGEFVKFGIAYIMEMATL